MSKSRQHLDTKLQFISHHQESFIFMTVQRYSSIAGLLAESLQCVYFPSFSLSALVSLLSPPDRSDIRNLVYQLCPGCWWKSWFATPDWISLSLLPIQPLASCPSRLNTETGARWAISTTERGNTNVHLKRGREGGEKRTEKESEQRWGQ